ncbi:3-hydroxyanthranilate 3,4-dioxygenase-like [Haliotis asinina]|uniref:3-hydroxyanthranilate 3,4-dioxygenase-like n=1 Tax=Haliotis asinina TaxID=109174 RepID=UPI003531F66B
MDTKPVVHSTDKWLEENKQFFLPPVCNKMMHKDGQLKVFYVGGPNQRKDYHIEEGEELFYMLKGDMCLKVVEKGVHRDVHIRQGEIFLLPGRIAHSPQRQENTVGLVIERERFQEEKDGLRYYVEDEGKPTLQSLYEQWFYCEDLGTQLGPVIKAYFASEQHKTGRPLPGTIPENPPVVLDSTISLQAPFNLWDWLNTHREELHSKGQIQLFGDQYQFDVRILGKGEHSGKVNNAEVFIWQIEGGSTVQVEGKDYALVENDTMLIKTGQAYTAVLSDTSIALICYQDRNRKTSAN